MSLNLNKVGVIARREYLTTVRRKAFVVTLLITPLIFFLSGVVGTKIQINSSLAKQAEARVVALVDSSGIYADAPVTFEYQPAVLTLGTDPTQVGKPQEKPKPVPVLFRRFTDQATALDSLQAGTVTQALVVSSDFLESGRLRVYEKDTRVFTSSGDQRPLTVWLTMNLLRGTTDSSRISRTLWMGRGMDYYTQDRRGQWAVKDDGKELGGFLLPFAFGFLLVMSVITGGQYLLQGIAEEKETRILESLMCSVTADELLLGKLVGLSGAALTLVGTWIVAGLTMGGSSLSLLHIEVPPSLLVFAFVYFVLGYLFYAGLMTSIGALASNLREATQIAGYMTILNVAPFWIITALLNAPNSGLAVGLSFFPTTAAMTMMLRLSAASVSGAVIPPWQIAASMVALFVYGAVTLWSGARLFRLGMLLYGKTPNLPEIMRILRQK